MPVPSGTNRNRSASRPAADAAFGEAARAHVVPEGHRDAAEALAEQRAHRYVAPAQVRRVDGGPVLGVDDAGYGDADGRGGPAEALAAQGEEFGGEAEDRLDDGFRAPLAAGGAARLVQQGAVPGDEGGLHPGAAHIEGDDVFHGFHRRQSRVLGRQRSSPLGGMLSGHTNPGARSGNGPDTVRTGGAFRM